MDERADRALRRIFEHGSQRLIVGTSTCPEQPDCTFLFQAEDGEGHCFCVYRCELGWLIKPCPTGEG